MRLCPRYPDRVEVRHAAAEVCLQCNSGAAVACWRTCPADRAGLRTGLDGVADLYRVVLASLVLASHSTADEAVSRSAVDVAVGLGREVDSFVKPQGNLGYSHFIRTLWSYRRADGDLLGLSQECDSRLFILGCCRILPADLRSLALGKSPLELLQHRIGDTPRRDWRTI